MPTVEKYTNYTENIELEPKFYPVANALINTALPSMKCFTQVSDAFAILVISGKKEDVKALSKMLRTLSFEAKQTKPHSDAGDIYWAAQVAGAQCGVYFSAPCYDKDFAPNKKNGFLLGAKAARAMMSQRRK